MHRIGLCSRKRLWPNRVRFEGSGADAAESRLGLGCSRGVPPEAFGDPVPDAPDRGPHHRQCRSRGPLKVCELGTTFSTYWKGGCRRLGGPQMALPTSGGAVHIGFRVLPSSGPPNPRDGSPSALALRGPLLCSRTRSDRGTQHKPRIRLLTGPRAALVAAVRGPSGNTPEHWRRRHLRVRVKCQFVDNLPTCVVEDEAGN